MIDISLEHVSKRYLIRQEAQIDQRRPAVLHKLLQPLRRPHEFWALRDISFEVQRGEALGIIGHNGAGKSTILKLLANITTPSSGEITINGRLSALIEVGSGFHPELTGRENIYLSASILGMKRSEITRKLESIVEFAGIHEFIDTPVKRYSSGMYVRLGFSIAAHLEPDILLLDEVLAVGDAAFQAKCLKRIKQLELAGTTIVFISHDLYSVKRLCSRVLLLESGRIIASGDPGEVIKTYTHASRIAHTESRNGLSFTNPNPDPDLQFEVEQVDVLDRAGRLKQELRTGDYVRFRIVWRAKEYLEDGGVELGMYTENGVPLIRYSNQPISGFDIAFRPGLNTVDLEFQQFPLTAGDYILSVGLSRPMIAWLHRNDNFGALTVGQGRIFNGEYLLTSDYSVMAVPHRWIVPEPDLDDRELTAPGAVEIL